MKIFKLIMCLWTGMLTIYVLGNIYKDITSTDSTRELEQLMDMNCLGKAGPFCIFAKANFEDITIFGVEDDNEIEISLRNSESYFELSYSNFSASNKIFAITESPNSGRTIVSTNKMLCDFNLDDIWDLCINFKLEEGEKVISYKFFHDGAWYDCVQWDSDEMILLLPNGKSFKWANNEKWNEQ